MGCRRAHSAVKNIRDWARVEGFRRVDAKIKCSLYAAGINQDQSLLVLSIRIVGHDHH